LVTPNRFSNSTILTMPRRWVPSPILRSLSRLDLEHDALRLDLGDAGNGVNGAADRRCREMADIDCHSDADIGRRQERCNG